MPGPRRLSAATGQCKGNRSQIRQPSGPRAGRRSAMRCPRRLAQWAVIGLLMALPRSAAPATADEWPAAFAAQVLALINARRAPLGLPALQAAADLDAIAAAHSRSMAAGGRLSHDGFSQRFLRSGGQTCVENLAAGLRQPGALVAAWWASPVHQRNLVAPRLQRAGLASMGGYVTFFACD